MVCWPVDGGLTVRIEVSAFADKTTQQDNITAATAARPDNLLFKLFADLSLGKTMLQDVPAKKS